MRTTNGPGAAAAAESTGPDQSPGPLSREHLRIGMALALGSFTVLLDTTVVSVATRTLAVRFGSSLTTVAWVSTAYLLTLSLVIPLGSRHSRVLDSRVRLPSGGLLPSYYSLMETSS